MGCDPGAGKRLVRQAGLEPVLGHRAANNELLQGLAQLIKFAPRSVAANVSRETLSEEGS